MTETFMTINRLFIVFVLLLTSSACWAQQIAPKIDQTVSLAGLKDAVIVRRDERGIAYIEAKNDADLFFAQGYVTAQDRLWQMDLYRRVARGETAEIFGNTVLEEDKRWRKFGFAAIAEETVKNTPAENRAALENYALGVNAYIQTLDDKTIPVEFQMLQYRPRDWTAADSLVVSKIFDDALSNSWRMDLMKQSLMDLPKEKRDQIFDPSSPLDVILVGKDNLSAAMQKNAQENTESLTFSVSMFDSLARIEQARKTSLERIGFYAEDLAASNNWVISGKRTLDGKPLLANDPHLRAAQPPIWYLINLSSPNLKVAGVTSAGIPGVILGHNESIAWGATNVGPDVQDLYLETFNAEGKYKTPTGWETPIVRKEEIKVRKSLFSKDTATETLEVVQTRNGAIFFEDGGKRYALKWTSLNSKNDLFTAFSSLNRAKNWTDFRNALKTYGGAMQNFVYADTQGNIGWIAAGKVPIRKTGDGSLPYDGATNDGEWTGFVPFDELPQLYNPPEGFIVTANQRTVGKSYKYHDIIARVNTVARAKRLQDLLNANRKVSINDVRDFQFDTFSVINSRFTREVVNAKAASDDTLKLLGGWDGRMNADSKAALVADAMRTAFRNRILAGAFGAERAKSIFLPYEGGFFDRLIAEKPKEWLPKEFASYADLLKACDTDARNSISGTLGADETKWTWGARNKLSFPHPLEAAPLIGGQFKIESLAQNGSGTSPNVGAAVSMRLIAAPGNWDSTRHGITTGQSGNPQSAHWKDQLDSWLTGNTPIFPFTKAAIDKAAKEVVLLTPLK